MNRSHALVGVCVATVAIVVGLARDAAAKPHVAVVPITGDAGGEILDALSAAVVDDISLVTTREIEHSMDKLGIGDDMSDREISKLVTDLEVDALIRGTLDRDGSGRLLHVRLYAFGKKSRGFTVHFKDVRAKKFKSAVHDAIMAKLALLKVGDKHVEAKVRAGDDDDDDTAKPPEPGTHAEREHGDDDDRTGHGGDEDRRPAKHHERAVDGDPMLAVPARAAAHLAVRADLGISLLTRSVTFNSTDIPEAPKSYTQSPVPGARFSGELYPFAFSHPTGPAGGLGIVGDYDQTLSLSLRTPSQPDTLLHATQRHWSVGVRYRISFGALPTSPTLALGVSYGAREFIVDRTPLAGAQIDLPDVDYKIIEPAALLRIPLGRVVALSIGGKGLLVRSAGAIEDPDQYGDASVYGVEAELGLDLVLGRHIALRVAGELTQIAFSFAGNGTLSNDRDNDPTTQDVAGATDRYIGGVATFAAYY